MNDDTYKGAEIPRYSMHFDTLWGTVEPKEDPNGAWVREADIEGRGVADAARIKRLEADLASARRLIRHQEGR